MINDGLGISSGYAYNDHDVERPDLITNDWLVDDSAHQANFFDEIDDLDLSFSTSCYGMYVYKFGRMCI